MIYFQKNTELHKKGENRFSPFAFYNFSFKLCIARLIL